MRIRDDMLIVSDDMGTSGTKLYDLDYADSVAGLALYIAATNGATDNKNNPIERNISKISIVDGSEVLWELPGDVAYALYSQEAGHPADEYHTGATSDAPYVEIPVRFGRELYDPELAFSPRNFKNPQLKVTFDEATVRAAGNTGFVSDSFALSIKVHLVEEGGSPTGFLSCKDIYQFTSLGSGDEVVDMPTDFPWRTLLIRAYEAGTDLRSTISNVKLNCDGGKFVPFDMTMNELARRVAEIYPMTFKAGYDGIVASETIQTWIGVDMAQAVTAHVANVMAHMGSAWPGQASMSTYFHDGTDLTDSPLHWSVRGYCPHNTVLVPFGRLGVPAEWFNAPAFKTAKLYLTQGNEGAEVNVCVQQYRPY